MKTILALSLALALTQSTFADHTAKCPNPVNLALTTLGLAEKVGVALAGVTVNETVTRFGYPMVTYTNTEKKVSLTFSTSLAEDEWPWLSISTGNPADLDLGKKQADIKDANSEFYQVTFMPDCKPASVMWNHLNMTKVYPFVQNLAGAEFCKNLNAGIMPHAMENFPLYLEYDVKQLGNIFAYELDHTIAMCKTLAPYLN